MNRRNRPIVWICIMLLLAFTFSSIGAFADETETTTPQTPTPVDDSLLQKAIEDAAAAKSGVRPSTDGKDIPKTTLWASQSTFNALNASISLAKEVLKNSAHTQEESDTQGNALNASIDIFKKALKYGTKTDETETVKEFVKSVLLKTDEAGADGKTHFVGEDFDAAYKNLSITVKGKTVKLNAYYTTNKSDGKSYETANQNTPLGTVALRWESSNPALATVSPNGLITPMGDGKVTITAAVSEESKCDGAPPSKKVALNIAGQQGEYVTSVTIVDEKGKSLSSKDDMDTLIGGKNKFFSFYAVVVWHDPATGKNRTEDTRTGKVKSSIKWSVGGSSVVGSINEDTGRFKSTQYSGNCYVQCKVTGGVGGATLSDIARVQVDTGEYEYNPASSLTLRVVYEKFPDKVVQEHKFTLAELASRLPLTTHNYTILGGDRYGVMRASGYLFKDVVALEGVDLGDVYQFRFKTADGYDNPITKQKLYDSGARYYFPNWDIGSRSGAQAVPPILATESSFSWNESEISPSASLSSATRFRLAFGSLWSGESNSSFQIYYISTITIVLVGAPPATNGNGPEKENGGDGGKTGGNGDGGSGGGTGSGSGTGNDGGTGSGGVGDGNVKESGGTGAGSVANSGGSAGAGTGTGIGSGVGRSLMPGEKKAALNNAAKTTSAAGENLMGTRAKKNANFRMYEMISASKSNVAPLNVDIPYLPLAGPIGGAGLLAGALIFLLGYRRRLS